MSYIEQIKELHNKIDIFEKNETSRRQSELFMIMNGLTDMVVMTDVNGIIKFANPASYRILGYTPQELVGCNIDKLVTNQNIKHTELINEYVNNGLYKNIICSGRFVKGKHKNGIDVPIYLYVGELNEKSSHLFVGVIHKVQDV